ALKTLDVREAETSVCGTKGGADMIGGLRINGVRNGRQFVTEPSFGAGGVAFNNGTKGESAADMEERLWIEAVREDKEVVTKPEQAYCVTRILEGIYESAKTGQPFYV
ncbi:MAG: gfo/Idh/MocA family oxidoreductase, partial [Clostridia bacterium]|nr:gfo/Idh/MocA family oxidoreductase [Clostridia bacterium]